LNRLFRTLREFVNKTPSAAADPSTAEAGGVDALPGFDNRIEVLTRYAESAAHYEDDLVKAKTAVEENLAMFEQGVEMMLDAGQDRDALEYVRLMVRLRPQVELLNAEIQNFHAVASALILRTNMLIQNLDEARIYARSFTLNPEATMYLDLPDRLAEVMMQVIDDRKLDLELATYILARRRALGSGQ
jgi:hypothetical protein